MDTTISLKIFRETCCNCNNLNSYKILPAVDTVLLYTQDINACLNCEKRIQHLNQSKTRNKDHPCYSCSAWKHSLLCGLFKEFKQCIVHSDKIDPQISKYLMNHAQRISEENKTLLKYDRQLLKRHNPQLTKQTKAIFPHKKCLLQMEQRIRQYFKKYKTTCPICGKPYYVRE